MLLYSALLLIGFLMLFKSADQFVIGSVTTAKNFHISPMLIGLTVVALGTSAPEIFVAAAASLRGEPELAVGNAIGSNIANMGMVLGLTAILVPLPFRPQMLKKDLPIMIFVTLCAGVALYDLKLGILDGVLLLFGLALFLGRVALEHRKEQSLELPELEDVPVMTVSKSIITLIVSLIFLLISAELLVYSVIGIAGQLGISELIIGLTVIAVGTSLPELVVSITSVLKGQTDMAIGNILGSNIFNILAVLAIPSFLAPSTIEPAVLHRDYALMLGMTLAITLFAYGMSSRARITRIEGCLLLAIWCIYILTLYYSASTGNPITVPF